MPSTERGYFKQIDAAEYLGVSVRYFQQHVDVTPIPFPGRTARPLEMYARADLDAWAERWRDPKARKSA